MSGGGRHGDAHVNSPGDHPSELTGLVRRADGDAAEFGDRGDVLPCGDTEGEPVLKKDTTQGEVRGGEPEPLPDPSPACLGRSPIQVLTRTP